MDTENRRLKILLVDDDKVDRMAIERFTREENLPYDIDTAASVTQARNRLQTNRFDVVILDYLLPDGTGLELLAELDGTPSIILTGSGNELVAVEALRMGAYDYLIKDSDRDYLGMFGATVRNAIERSRTHRELREAHEGLRQKVESLHESEALFRSLVQTAGNVIVFLAPDRRILEWNLEAERVFGWSRDEVLGRDYFELFLPPEVRTAIGAEMEKVLGGEPTRGSKTRSQQGTATNAYCSGMPPEPRTTTVGLPVLSPAGKTLPSGISWRSSCANRSAWKQSASSPPVLPTISTTCSRESWATWSWPSTMFPRR